MHSVATILSEILRACRNFIFTIFYANRAHFCEKFVDFYKNLVKFTDELAFLSILIAIFPFFAFQKCKFVGLRIIFTKFRQN